MQRRRVLRPKVLEAAGRCRAAQRLRHGAARGRTTGTRERAARRSKPNAPHHPGADPIDQRPEDAVPPEIMVRPGRDVDAECGVASLANGLRKPRGASEELQEYALVAEPRAPQGGAHLCTKTGCNPAASFLSSVTFAFGSFLSWRPILPDSSYLRTLVKERHWPLRCTARRSRAATSLSCDAPPCLKECSDIPRSCKWRPSIARRTAACIQA